MKKLASILLSRLVIFSLLILLQIYGIIIVILKFSKYSIYFALGSIVISIIAVLAILNNRKNSAYKLAWVIAILIFPIIGVTFYLLFGMQKINKRVINEMKKSNEKTIAMLTQNPSVMENLRTENLAVANEASYILNTSHYPVYQNTTVEYLNSGGKKFEKLKEELAKAEHYIFIEYFIIEEGLMWNSILDILIEKVKQGVDVRVIYDDVGCLKRLPYKYNRILESYGIKCKVFNPFVPLLSIIMNNRDHRKIVVIDGHTAFTGGINLADEYINVNPHFYKRYGYWKDTAVMLKGEAVWNFAVMFLTAWDSFINESEDYYKFLPDDKFKNDFNSNEFVLPFGDSPLDNDNVGEMAYLNMINQAKKYVYITTPYLILDNETVTALCLAAKKGVDVRIITPHIPDKWYVHMVTRGNYPMLIESGVKIYEFTPGFIHSKTFVSDEQLAIVGTINLDYRSLYLHFECATWMYKSRAVFSVKEDFVNTLEQSERVTLEDCKNIKWITKFMRTLMKAFAPLL